MTHKTLDIDIIVTCKNNEDIIERCLDSILEQSYNTKIYLCDDGSTDDTVRIVQRKFKKVRILLLNGYPALNRNQAILISNSKYIVTMDSDAFLTKDWIKKMVEFMETDSNIGIAGGKLLMGNNILQAAGGTVTKRGTCYDRGFNTKFSDIKTIYPEIKKVGFVSSASMIVRREMLAEIGMFEPSFLYGFEDTDLGIRANLAGWDVLYNPDVHSFHDFHGTVKTIFADKGVDYFNKRNKLFMVLTNFQLFSLIKYSPFFLGEFLLQLFHKNKIATLRAYLSNFFRIPCLLKVRKKIQQTRRISDGELFEKVDAKL